MDFRNGDFVWIRWLNGNLTPSDTSVTFFAVSIMENIDVFTIDIDIRTMTRRIDVFFFNLMNDWIVAVFSKETTW